MFSRIKRMMVYPDGFFQETGSSVREAFLLYAFISFIVLLVDWILLFTLFVPANFAGFQYVFTGKNGAEALIPALFFLGGLILIFLYTAFVIIFSRIKKLTCTFRGVFAALAYGAIPATAFSWVPILNLLFGIWSWYLQVKGISVLHKVSEKDAFIVTIPAVAAIAVVFVLLTLLITSLFPA